MKKNMGTADRVIRVFLAIIVGVLYAAGQLTGLAAVILGLFAVIFFATSLVGYCPAYSPFKLSTAKREAKP